MTNLLTVLALGVLSFSVTSCTSPTASSPVDPSSAAGAPTSLSRDNSSGVTTPLPAAGAKPGDKTIVEIVLADDGEFDVLQAAVVRVLLYHVTNGRRNSNAVLGAPRYQMLNGETLTRDDLVAAGIAATDISASSGIVHVINAVLLPPS